MMNPDKEIIKDQIKIMGHIDGHSSPYTFMQIKSLKTYKRANLEGQKALVKAKDSDRDSNLMFRQTINTPDDLLSVSQ